MYNFRTDMADERRNLYAKENNIEDSVNGIEVNEEKINDKIKITRVKIINEEGEKAIGKKKGDYITIDINKINYLTDEEKEETEKCIAKELKKIIDNKINSKDEILIVGLGNKEITPDALGPDVIKNIEITRHIIKYLPECIDENTRPVCAIAPGVLGTTGIETNEVIKGVAEHVKPKLIIVIDALASRSIERISSSIQISNTGIIPGAGVGNTRKELTEESLKIPVISLGIPTVVELATLISEGIDIFIDNLQEINESNECLNKLKDTDKYENVKDALNIYDYNMIVTPKEIDELIQNMSEIIANGINMSM